MYSVQVIYKFTKIITIQEMIFFLPEMYAWITFPSKDEKSLKIFIWVILTLLVRR